MNRLDLYVVINALERYCTKCRCCFFAVDSSNVLLKYTYIKMTREVELFVSLIDVVFNRCCF